MHRPDEAGDDRRFPAELVEALTLDLLAVYDRAGREVRYVDKHGKDRAYWPRRYKQALNRAIANKAVVAFAESLARAGEPSRGFFLLKDGDRLDLTVEAVIADTSKPYHELFSPEAVGVAAARVREHAAGGLVPALRPPTEAKANVKTLDMSPGATFYLRVTVGDGGELQVSLAG
jgi:hypothetical protein